MMQEKEIIREKLDYLEQNLESVIRKFMIDNVNNQSRNLGIDVEIEHIYIEGSELPVSSNVKVNAKIKFEI